MKPLAAAVQLIKMSEQLQQELGVELEHSAFCCPVCLELLEDPVTLHCGHSYCRSCAEGCWDHVPQKGQYSCPQCRETFTSRPVLGTNNLLAEVVEKLKQTSNHQASASALTCAGPADVACDFCCEAKPNKATMSCLTCLASYCPAHLRPHYSVPVLKTHQLVSALLPLQDKMCTTHNKLMEIYCQTDKMCICYLCTIDEHKLHQTVSAAAKRDEEQKQLPVIQNKLQERFQDREKELKELLQALKDFKSGIQTVVESCDNLFDQLISSIKTRSGLTKQMITAREAVAVAEAKRLQLQLEEEIAKLRKRDADLQQLARTDDHVCFIRTFQSLSSSCESPDLPPASVVRPPRSVETVTNSISELRVKVENLVKETWSGICDTVSFIDVVLPPVPKTTQEFLRYSCPLTLDVNSASNYLSISEDNRRVCGESYEMNYSAQSERFKSVRQVLCREGLSGRCYWEVTLTGRYWSVAVAYKDVSRSSYDDSEFGKNNKSWSLECSSCFYTFHHNSQSKAVFGPESSRIGVYLDHKAGALSFYSVSDKRTLLHRARASFSQPLYPGLGLKAVGCLFSKNCAEVMKLW